MCAVLFLLAVLSMPAEAENRQTKEVLSCETMERALELSLAAQGQENAPSWLELLALAAAYGEGVPSPVHVVHVCYARTEGKTAEEILNGDASAYRYWLDAYETALGGIVGNYTELADGEWKECCGVKGCFPIADGYWYTYSDAGASECVMVGLPGTPVAAVEAGEVESMGWDRYSGWQITIRSADGRRRCRYSCLRTEMPYASGIRQGIRVEPGQVIGFMGQSGTTAGKRAEMDASGYLCFEVQKIGGRKRNSAGMGQWFDVSELVRLLACSRSAVVCEQPPGTWSALHPRVSG